MGYRESIKVEEEKLFRSLTKIYNKVKFDLDKAGANWQDIQFLYHKKTDDIIRSSVTAVYELSARKTVERDIRVPYYLTQRDLEEIRRLSQKYQTNFWLSLDREINTHNTLGVKQRYDPDTLLLVKSEDKRLRDGFIGRIAQSVHGEAAASAVVSKARQVVSGNNNIRRRNQTEDNPYTKRRGFRKAAVEGEPPSLIWKTRGSNTCIQCDSLGETRYLLDDPNTPIPSQDTHPRCQCELVLEGAALEGDIEEASELFF